MTSRVLVALRVDCPPERAFEAFTSEIGQWWRPSPLFQFTPGRTGVLAFEGGPDGSLTEVYDNGERFEIGRVRAWEPPSRLVLSWRQASFAADQETELHVRFEAVEPAEPVGPGRGPGTRPPSGHQTRVTVEHFGWDTIPQEHAARHGFPLLTFQQRHAEWWRTSLEALRRHVR